MQIACGQSHTIIITSSKKVYTFGNGKKGQLGHKSFSSEDNPRVVSFFEEMKTNHPLQVAASFSSSIVLLSNNKVYWFGSNGTIKMVSCPVLFDMRTKVFLLLHSHNIYQQNKRYRCESYAHGVGLCQLLDSLSSITITS